MCIFQNIGHFFPSKGRHFIYPPLPPSCTVPDLQQLTQKKQKKIFNSSPHKVALSPHVVMIKTHITLR